MDGYVDGQGDRVAAFVSLDCASKQRVRYFLPTPVTEAFLRLFEAEAVTINRFSAVSKGAKDHFNVEWTGHLVAAGVLGEASVVATYGKLGEPGKHAQVRAEFETAVREFCRCPIEELTARPG